MLLRKRLHRASRGFSLVEMLVTMGVAGFLILMASTWYKDSLDRACTAKCTGNLRSILVGTLSYAAEHNGKLWTRTDVGYSRFRMVDDPLGLPKLLEDYVSSKTVWLCPAGRKSLQKFGNSYTWAATPAMEKESIFTMDSPITIIWDTYAYSLPSMRGASDDFKGDGTSSLGPSSLPSKYQVKPHRRQTSANWGRTDGSVVTGPTAAR